MLRETGMCGTGIKAVVSRSGAPIGSLYHYFPGGKTQLVSEALTLHAGKFPLLAERFFSDADNPADALRSLFNTAADAFERQGANKGCAIGAVALDLAPSDEQVRLICDAAFSGWAASIAQHLGIADKRVGRSLAVTVIAALEGAFVLARAAKSGEPFRDVGDQLASMITVLGGAKSRRVPKRRMRRKR
jgi:TetR/AcrR family transcriptional repressor of lmrAB and yxaGH operons